jgi:hypothetical protein
MTESPKRTSDGRKLGWWSPSATNPLVVLVRHATHDDHRLTVKGVNEVQDTARSLAWYLRDTGSLDNSIEVIYTLENSAGTETLATAQEIRRVLTSEGATMVGTARRLAVTGPRVQRGGIVVELMTEEVPEGPSLWLNAYSRPHEVRKIVRHAMRCLASLAVSGDPPGRVVLLIGNEPFIGWAAGDLGAAIHLGHGEMAGFERRVRRPKRWAWRLAWTLCSTDEEATRALRDKIRSKMDVAKVYGALGTGLLVFLLQQGAQPNSALTGTWELSALLLFGSGTTLYVATLFSYDRLLMPKQFWSAGRPGRRPRWLVRRPPSADRWVLYQNMMHTWRWLFGMACVLIGGGLLALGIGVFQEQAADWWLVAAGAAIAVTLGWSWWHRPRLGAED